MKRKKIDMDELYRRAIEKINNAPNDQAFRIRTERALENMKRELDAGLITHEEFMDLEFFYYETWVEPITLSVPVGGKMRNFILN
tara:strand:- start:452 stop:706 length:255 start_codon:yes stop_codon:yes gene_type:complete